MTSLFFETLAVPVRMLGLEWAMFLAYPTAHALVFAAAEIRAGHADVRIASDAATPPGLERIHSEAGFAAWARPDDPALSSPR